MKKLSIDEIKQRIKIRFPDENFTIIEYTSLGKPLKIQCDKCKKIYIINKASNFFCATKAHGCVNCYGLWKEKERFLQVIQQKYDIIKQQVIDTHIHYTIQCKECGHIRTDALGNLRKHLECGCITGVYKKRTPEEFIKTVNLKSNNEYELASEYTGQTNKVSLRHIPCGLIREVSCADVIRLGCRCWKCDNGLSYGAKRILNFLNNRNIPYEIEKYIPDTGQRFDFYIPIKNPIAIEYNGIQHYQEVPFFHNTLQEQQELDKKKENYCLKNNIKLLIIDYNKTYEEIDEILNNTFAKFNDYPEKEQV